MRRRSLVVLCIVISACGDAARGAATPTPDVASLPRIARPPASATAAASAEPANDLPADGPLGPGVGGLHNVAALEKFYEAVSHLEDGTAPGDVRIAYFGDSHTAADFETGAVRRLLQARFGDGGRGFVALGAPFAHYVQEGVRVGGAGFVPERGLPKKATKKGASTGRAARKARSAAHAKAPLHHGEGRARRADASPVPAPKPSSASTPKAPPPSADGRYGLAGAAVEATKRDASAWVEVAAPSSSVEIAYLEAPRGGSFDLFVDGARAARVATRKAVPMSAFRVLPLSLGPHRLEARAVGDGPVRLFGAAFDVPRAGLVLDALGVNGARFPALLAWDETHLQEQLRHRAPALVVFAYGTNEADDDRPIADYEASVGEVLARVGRAVPDSACLLVGPPDRAVKSSDGWITPPRLFEVIAAQQRAAAAGGCAYYDQLSAMGGPGTMAAWAAEDDPRGRPDRVHLTRSGYAILGQTLAGDLLRGYQGFRADRGQVADPGDRLASATPLSLLQRAAKTLATSGR